MTLTLPMALVIDDNRLIANSLVQMLAALGYDAGAAYGALPAMQTLMATPPDIVILDIHLQAVNGVEVCRYIRRTDPLTRIPVVAISSDTQPELVAAMRAAGANAFLPKPIQLEALERALQDAQEDAARR